MASGVEVEKSNVIYTPPEFGSNVRGKVLAEVETEGVTLQILVEEELVWYKDDRYYWNRIDAGPGAREVDASIPEFVVGVVADSEHESYGRHDIVHEHLRNAENALRRIRGNPGDAATTPLPEIFRPEAGWQMTPLGEKSFIGPRIFNSKNSTHSVHYNVGIPLSMVHSVVKRVYSSPGRDLSKDAPDQARAFAFMEDSFQFGNQIAALYAYGKYMGPNPPPAGSFNQIVAQYADIPDKEVQEVRSLATILAAHAAMSAYSEVHPGDINLTKNLTTALARHDPAQLLAELSPQARAWLSVNHRPILGMFDRIYSARVPGHLEKAYAHGYEVTSVLDSPTFHDYLTVGDFMMSGLREGHSRATKMSDIVSANVLRDLDRSGRNPLVVLEFRSYGNRGATLDELESNHKCLSSIAKVAQDQAVLLGNPSRELHEKVVAVNASLRDRLRLSQPAQHVHVPDSRNIHHQHYQQQWQQAQAQAVPQQQQWQQAQAVQQQQQQQQQWQQAQAVQQQQWQQAQAQAVPQQQQWQQWQQAQAQAVQQQVLAAVGGQQSYGGGGGSRVYAPVPVPYTSSLAGALGQAVQYPAPGGGQRARRS
ncbi:hypothetical protein ACFWD7_56995 [Streptomyces mirabilis]|uniref:hypothetical protein n=1 Tax=Streptomyces mirabilis TaxID=68239 RepID=UPI00368B15D5